MLGDSCSLESAMHARGWKGVHPVHAEHRRPKGLTGELVSEN